MLPTSFREEGFLIRIRVYGPSQIQMSQIRLLEKSTRYWLLWPSWLHRSALPWKVWYVVEVWDGTENPQLVFHWQVMMYFVPHKTRGDRCLRLLTPPVFSFLSPFINFFLLISWQNEWFSAKLVSWNWLTKQSKNRASLREGTGPPLLLALSFYHLTAL